MLNRRTLERDNRRLASLLRSGMSVLDVGCGTGAITAGIARRVAPGGMVVGADRDNSMLDIARTRCDDTPNLSFQQCDILSLPFDSEFDVVSAARTIQWVSDTAVAVAQLTKAARPGGQIVILDYAHAQNRWGPEPPAAFACFYAAFLAWREANSWDNRLASRLPDLLASSGITTCEVHRSDEIAQRGDEDFADTAGIWLSVMDKLGPRMIGEGYTTMDGLRAGRDSYQGFIESQLDRQVLSLQTVIGIRPAG